MRYQVRIDVRSVSVRSRSERVMLKEDREISERWEGGTAFISICWH
jgi:hypothetical protein